MWHGWIAADKMAGRAAFRGELTRWLSLVVRLSRGQRQLVERIVASWANWQTSHPRRRYFSDRWWRFNGVPPRRLSRVIIRYEDAWRWRDRFWIIGRDRLNRLRSILTISKVPRRWLRDPFNAFPMARQSWSWTEGGWFKRARLVTLNLIMETRLFGWVMAFAECLTTRSRSAPFFRDCWLIAIEINSQGDKTVGFIRWKFRVIYIDGRNEVLIKSFLFSRFHEWCQRVEYLQQSVLNIQVRF